MNRELKTLAVLAGCAALALGACEPQAQETAGAETPAEVEVQTTGAEVSDVGAPSTPAELIDPSYCLAITVLYADAIETDGAPGDVTAVDAVGARYRALFDARYPGDQGAQYLASNRAVFDDLTHAQFAEEQARCAAAVDQDWSAGDW